jgi:hypothetical protein
LERRRYFLKQIIIPANNVAFVLCIWEKEGYLKHEITPVNNVAFELYIWKKGGISLKIISIYYIYKCCF